MENLDLISARNIEKSFVIGRNRTFRVINNINLNIKKGELLGVVGFSGSGKTTLLRTLLQLIKPDRGQVFFKNLDITKLNEKQLRKTVRSKLRLVYQHPEASLNPGITVSDILRQPYELHFSDKKQNWLTVAKSLLNKMGISESYLSKYQHELSGGEKRRIALARALMTEPEVLFADEPLSGLDRVLQYRMLTLLIKIQSELGLTLVLVSHDIDIMVEVCDRIIVLENGMIVDEAARLNGRVKFNNPEKIKLIKKVI